MSQKRIMAGYTEERSVGFQGGAGNPVTITGLQVVGGPKPTMDRYVDLQFANYQDARDFANSILGFVGDPK